jgi:L-amino acid N-acyltransferase YncA
MTETLADISIETLEGYRRRGIGRAVVARLIDEVIRLGKVPVWGATEDNTASLALAASLGFTRAAGELFVCEVDRPVQSG